MSQILQQFKGQSIRIIRVDGETRFVLKDLCAALELANYRNVAARLDEDEKGVHLTDTPGGRQPLITVNESGLYAVILRSDKPVAREFRKWVTNEVLPALRQAGTYTVPTKVAPTPAPAALDLSALQQMANLIPVAIESKVAQAKAEIRQEVSQEIDEKVGSLPATSEQRWEVKQLVSQIVSRRRELGLGRSHWSNVYTEAWATCQVGSIETMTRDQFPKVQAYLTAELTALGAMAKSGLFSEAQAVQS